MRIPTAAEVTDETMMPLSVAAEVAVAHGVVSSASAKALRREAEHDRLTTYEVFGRLHTTLGDIKRMVKRCRVQPKAPTSTGRLATPAGSSETQVASNAGRAAALESVKRLKERCKRTSPTSTTPISAAVIPLQSRSRTS
ncbi:hypothetical protein [Methylobacterium brachiatum]